MKIERVNEHQIRCTLTKADLAERELKLSELAYGTEKAKSLFRDMMQQASYQFGFEAEDIPLMIEAIPLSGETIVLIITKVEDPEELDTRFSRFAPSLRGSGEEISSETVHIGADDILDLFKKLTDQALIAQSSVPQAEALPQKKNKRNQVTITVPVEITKLYSFEDLDGVIKLSQVLKSVYDGENTLYRGTRNGRYYLLVKKSSHTPEEFNKICNIITEFARIEKITPATESYFTEHGDVVIPERALQQLTKVEIGKG